MEPSIDPVAASQPATLPQQNINIPPQPISEQERKRAKMAEHIAATQRFFSTVSKGLLKIVEELSSLILKR